MRLFSLVAAVSLSASAAMAQEYASDKATSAAAVPGVKASVRTAKRAPAKPAPVLDKPEKVSISSDFAEEYGWQVTDDASTGVRIGLPTKMVPEPRESKIGSLWSSRHNTVRVETFRISGTALAAFYEETRKNSRDRQIEQSALRPDSFVVHGLQGLKWFTTRAFVKGNEIRGYTISYDQAMAGIVAPVAAAMAGTFAAFPTVGAAYASGKSVDETNAR